MKGKNTLKLNEETMFEAMQLWVSQEFSFEPKPEVIAVRQIIPQPIYQNNESIQPPSYYEIDVQTAERK